MKLLFFSGCLAILLFPDTTDGNIRCYSCSKCDEFEYFAGDLSRFETDCVLDRHCLKVSGTTTDIHGYSNTVSFRGCPWALLFPKLQEGCTASTFTMPGVGEVVGEICLCSDYLCNGSGLTTTADINTTALLTLFLGIFIFNNYS